MINTLTFPDWLKTAYENDPIINAIVQSSRHHNETEDQMYRRIAQLMYQQSVELKKEVILLTIKGRPLPEEAKP